MYTNFILVRNCSVSRIVVLRVLFFIFIPISKTVFKINEEEVDNPSNDGLSTPKKKKKRGSRGGDLHSSEKLRHRQQKFRQEWKNDILFKSWIQEVPNDNVKARCKYCNIIMVK